MEILECVYKRLKEQDTKEIKMFCQRDIHIFCLSHSKMFSYWINFIVIDAIGIGITLEGSFFRMFWFFSFNGEGANVVIRWFDLHSKTQVRFLYGKVMRYMTKNLKEQAFQIVQQRNLYSLMNDTKWRELRMSVLNEMPFGPPYIMKTLFEQECKYEEEFQNDVCYLGDWYEGLTYGEYFHGYFAIEWMKVRPRYLKSRGKLIGPEVIDASDQFEKILNQYHIPYEIENGMYCIYGYR